MDTEYSAGAVVFSRQHNDTLFLLILSRRHGNWGFPKGHIEQGETEEQAARREIREETGLTEVTFLPKFRYEDVYPATSNRGQNKGKEIEKHSVYFLAETRGLDVCIDPHEIADFRWLSASEAQGLLHFENQRRILGAALSLLKA